MSLDLMDTNILLRSADPTHASYAEVTAAVSAMRTRGHQLCLVAQVLVEFRAVATRPISVNGLGLSQQDVDGEIARLSYMNRVFPDEPAMLATWKLLVSTYGSIGKQNHDLALLPLCLPTGFRLFSPTTRAILRGIQ